jgi:hypothetical protein
VAAILDQLEYSTNKSFVQVALDHDMLDRADAEQLLIEQQASCPSIRTLVVQCGLLTQRQTEVLFQHFQKTGTRPIPQRQKSMLDSPVESKPITAAHDSLPIDTPQTPVDEPGLSPMRPPQPKFKQRPVIVQSYSNTR